MHSLLKYLLSLLAAGCLALPAMAAELGPDALARNVTNDVLQIVRQDKDIANGNTAKVNALVEQKILPLFDFKHMTQLAVGKHWPRATPAQQENLTEQFRVMLVRTYASSLTSVADYKIEFKPFRASPADSDVTVSTEVSKPGAPPILIDYRLEKNGGNGWKVFDVVVDNVSLVTVYRNSFNSEVRKGGIDGLIAALSRRNNRP
ncbi:MAG: ABC transporter substrate-binding protein [Pseudomonadota bacterium]|nr:ABC transporter substrate-binding protein [Pseudomonadota bacterium]MDP1904416.1 ABC transporter substrate-binding protein [Pseudomonadota bacterium]MDP2353884.1 ABC transporter substrate-binding protein [Pseudomonadota bacterium]